MPKTKVNHINIYYEVHGEGDPLLLIYGLAGRGNSFKLQLPTLSQRFKTIIFDNRGTGESDQPESAYSIEQMADDAAGLLEHLDIESANVFGISMGGMIAQEMVLKYPDHVKKLALGCTHCGIKHCVPSPDWVTEIFRSLPGKPREQAVHDSIPFNYSPYTQKNNRQLIETMTPVFVDNRQKLFAYENQIKAVYAFDAFERLPQINKPTIVLTGMDDVLIPPENSKIIADRIPNSKLVEFENAGHLFFIEQAETVNQTLTDFFTGDLH